MGVLGQWWLNRMIAAARARGERFEARDGDPIQERVTACRIRCCR